MKIVALLATPHGSRGNTARLLERVAEGARGAGAQWETVELDGSTVLPCRACDACHRTGECPQQDEFRGVRAKVLAADGLVLASPNYVFNVTAQLKAFMDRCCGVIHCMGFRGRYGASVVTSGGGGDEAVAEIMNRFLVAVGVVPVGSVWAVTGGLPGGELPEEVRAGAEDLGRTLVEAWRERRSYPDAEEALAAFRERMRELVAHRKEDWPFEYEYWRALQETV